MKAIVCEMCNSHDVIKQDGYYVCQSCGTKYSTEDAKKLMIEISGAVKVDNTKQLENYYQLARQARENNNAEDAQKYYDLIRQDDPNNWEACFFAVYYKAIQCKIINIASAASSVANNMESTVKRVADIQSVKEKNDALNSVIVYSQTIAKSFSSTAINHYDKFSTTADAKSDIFDRLHATRKIYASLESCVKKYFSADSEILVAVQKAEHAFMMDSDVIRCMAAATNLDGFKKWSAEALRIKREVQQIDPLFGQNTKKKGCYVATAVYGSYDSPQVWILRRYRDDTLAATWYGRAFIHTYYAISPTLVKWFGKTEWFKNLWKPKLDRMVEKLRQEGVEDTPYQDRDW